jgi:hypothetical protein
LACTLSIEFYHLIYWTRRKGAARHKDLYSLHRVGEAKEWHLVWRERFIGNRLNDIRLPDSCIPALLLIVDLSGCVMPAQCKAKRGFHHSRIDRLCSNGHWDLIVPAPSAEMRSRERILSAVWISSRKESCRWGLIRIEAPLRITWDCSLVVSSVASDGDGEPDGGLS